MKHEQEVSGSGSREPGLRKWQAAGGRSTERQKRVKQKHIRADLLLFTAAVLALGPAQPPAHAQGYYDFAESFDGTRTPWMLEQPQREDPTSGELVSFDGVKAVFPDNWRGKYFDPFLRTRERGFSLSDFVVEATVTVPEGGGIAYLGLGVGKQGVNSEQGPSARPHIWCEIRRTDGKEFFTAIDNFAFVSDPLKLEVEGAGTRRLRLEWQASAKVASCRLDKDYDAATFRGDLEKTPINGADNGFTEDNSSIFFGGYGGVSFDDLVVTGTHVGVE